MSTQHPAMNLFSESAQDSPPGANPSDIVSLARKFKTPTACVIIFSLQFLGCDIESIFSVLESYDQGGTIFDVARYIKALNLLQHHEFSPPDGQQTYNNLPWGTTIVIDYARGWPVKFVAKSKCIRTMVPRQIVGVSMCDGRKVITIVVEGEVHVRCS